MLAITSTLKFGELPGNVVLNKGEANLPRKRPMDMSKAYISVPSRNTCQRPRSFSITSM
jgi:hypothetical protein